MENRVAELEKKVAQHEVRFGNGRQVMAEIKSELDALKPKTPDWLKLFLAGLTVVAILMGAQLWLTDRFAERPRFDQVDVQLSPLEDKQDRMAETVREIQRSQTAQEQSIERIEQSQQELGAKLDEVLDRPRRR